MAPDPGSPRVRKRKRQRLTPDSSFSAVLSVLRATQGWGVKPVSSSSLVPDSHVYYTDVGMAKIRRGMPVTKGVDYFESSVKTWKYILAEGVLDELLRDQADEDRGEGLSAIEAMLHSIRDEVTADPFLVPMHRSYRDVMARDPLNKYFTADDDVDSCRYLVNDSSDEDYEPGSSGDNSDDDDSDEDYEEDVDEDDESEGDTSGEAGEVVSSGDGDCKAHMGSESCTAERISDDKNGKDLESSNDDNGAEGKTDAFQLPRLSVTSMAMALVAN